MNSSFSLELRKSFLKIYFISQALLFSTGLFFEYSIYQSHVRVAENFVSIVREQVLIGDSRAAMHNSKALTQNESRFFRIAYLDLHNRQVFNVMRDQSVPEFPLHFTVNLPLYFDIDQNNFAGNFVFTYSFEKLSLSIGLLFLVGTVCAVIIFFALRKNLLLSYSRDLDHQKKSVIIRVMQNITHDMRAPIGTFERLLLTEDDEMPQMKPAIRESVNRLYTMVESLRHGEIENIVKKSWHSLDFSYGYESLIGKANSNYISLIVPQYVLEKIYIDQSKVERAWINLASNALEFAKTKVAVEAERKDDVLIIRVVDDGPGVPDVLLPHLFQRGATYGKSDGTGLGLAYVKQVMMGHGGDIRYYREDNLTVFECFIPNAFDNRADGLIEQSDSSSVTEEPTQRIVGIAFTSFSLCSEVLDGLTRVKYRKIMWKEGFDKDYDFIVTDDPNIVDRCIDGGISVAQFKPNTPASEIVRRTLIRLGIPQSGRTEDV